MLSVRPKSLGLLDCIFVSSYIVFFVSPFADLFGLDVSVGAQGAFFIFTFLMSMECTIAEIAQMLTTNQQICLTLLLFENSFLLPSFSSSLA
jgi:hypothetical protein